MGLFLAAISAIALHSPAVCGHEALLREAFTHGLMPTLEKPLAERRLEGLTDTDVISNTLDLTPNFTTHALTGTNTMVVKSLVSGLTQLHLRLGNNFAITSVTLDGRPVTSTFEDSSHLRINFDQPYSNGSTFTLVIAYNGVTAGAGFGSIVWGTHSGANYCFTLSEPWYAYTWWPNKDDNTDKALMSVNVTVPNSMQVASNGILQGTDTLGSNLRYRWSSTAPMSPYLACFGATNFNHFSDTYTYTGGTMPLEFYIWPESDTVSHRNTWLDIKQMLTTLGQWYGDYPFLDEKIGLYQFTFSGGMEHQTMIGMNGFSDNLTVHELGHQWWGDNVTCATWSDIWLNEGFADYTEAVWAEKKPGSTGLAALKSAMASRRPSGTANGTVYVNPATDPNRIFSTDFTYYKGGWAQHMLRHVLGDTTFWSGLSLYRTRFVHGAATTVDYQTAMQDASGQDLSTFFNQWIFLPGEPQYQYGWTNLLVNGQRYLAMHIKQVQSASYPTFVMPIDMDVTAGSTTRSVINNSAATQNYLFPLAANATAVTLDPDVWILNSGIASVSYVPGPPKMITSTPLPGGTIAAGAPITVTFHTPVNITASDISISPGTRRRSPFYTPIVSYDSATNTATITTDAPLQKGTWNLTIAPTVTAVNSGQALDGELNGTGAAAFPSGNGIAGGSSTIPFTVN